MSRGLARKVYKAFWPDAQAFRAIQVKHGMRIKSVFKPCAQIGGDMLKVIDVDDAHFGLLSVDFSGHGVFSALNTAYIHAMTQKPMDWLHPDRVLMALNQQLCHVLDEVDFATAVYVLVNSQTLKITYCNCGAPVPVFMPAGGGAPQWGQSSGRPLGLAAGIPDTLPVFTYKGHKGDQILLYSDALLETRHTPDNVRWMQNGLDRVLRQCQFAPQKRDKLAMVHDAFLQTARQPLDDDLTMVGITL